MMAVYSRVCSAIAKALVAANLVGLGAIVVGMGLQVLLRYASNNPIQATDEIAQNALTWMCFLGAAFIYRERGHIEVDFFVNRMSKPVAKTIAVCMEILVVAVLLMMINQIVSVAPTMTRVAYGTLLLSKFHLQYLPALISAACTILFAVEHILNICRGGEERRESFQI